MCACGCFLLVAVAAGVGFLILHGLWWAAALLLIVSAVIGWFGAKASGWRPKPK
jgi:hypothetical protein